MAYLHGNRFGSVVAIKGIPGEAEAKGKPFFGADAEALERALTTLGWGSNNWCGVAINLPQKGSLSAQDLRLLIETIDPLAILALDEKAQAALKDAYGAELMPQIPKPGTKAKLLGRTLVFINGFEAALASTDDKEAKQRVWKQLKALKQ